MSAYVLITPARNEEAYIEKTIQAVLAQTILPEKWVIVSDNSTDRTDEIISQHAEQHDFIQHLRVTEHRQRNFGAKIEAIHAGCKQLGNRRYEFWGNLDADVTFEPRYYEKVLAKFRENTKLGIAGGIVLELIDGHFVEQHTSLNSVAGAVQLFRRPCYEEIGGYMPLVFGGEDAAAEIMVRMRGWEVQTFPELKVFHHRRVANGNGSLLRSRFRQGITSYLLGYHPLFQMMRCCYRIIERPYFLGSAFMLGGYCLALLQKRARPLPDEAVNYLRAEQMERVLSIFRKKT